MMLHRSLLPVSCRPRTFRQKLSVLAAIFVLFSANVSLTRASLIGDWVADTYQSGDPTWTDSTGNGHTATAVGPNSLTVTANALNGHAAINFFGGNGVGAQGYFTVANDGSTLVGATGLTLVAVIQPTAAGTSVGGNFYNQAGVIGNEQGGVVNDWDLGFASSQAVGGIGNPDTTLTSAPLTLDQPYIEIGTWDTSGLLTLYINGVQVAQTNTGSTGPRDANGNGQFALGADTANDNGDLHIFTGQVGELRVYNDNTENIAALTNSLAAVYGIPEPSTWAEVLAGAGLLALGCSSFGRALRRRSQAWA